MHVTVVAEVGSVHDGSFGNALRLIDAASECGVDAVKFQTHIAEAETLPNAPAPSFFAAEPRFEYFRRTAFSEEQWRALKSHADARGVLFLSSPFSEEAVDLLARVGMTRYKIPSGEITNLPLIEKIARLGKPVLLSSGMSSWDELDRAVTVVRRQHDELTVLQCTTEYPCPYERVGLNVMVEMQRRYGVAVGLSDHSLTPYASLAAVALGATVVEKHFTFSRRMYGSDARHSMEPDEMADLVTGVRAIERMLENPVDKNDTRALDPCKRVFEKSLVTVAPVASGTVLTREMIGIKKPGGGIPPSRLEELLGRRLVRDLPEGSALSLSDVE
jgi:N,N'-diacetyllegionaminate synthase